MRKPNKELLKSVFVLFLSLSLAVILTFFFIKDILFVCTYIKGEAQIIRIDKSGTSEKPIRIYLIYRNKFREKNVTAYIFCENNATYQLHEGDIYVVYYGKFFSSDIRLKSDFPNLLSFAIDFIAITISILSFLFYMKKIMLG